MQVPIGTPKKKKRNTKEKRNTCSLRREGGVPSKAGLVGRAFLVQSINSLKIAPKQKPGLRLFWWNSRNMLKIKISLCPSSYLHDGREFCAPTSRQYMKQSSREDIYSEMKRAVINRCTDSTASQQQTSKSSLFWIATIVPLNKDVYTRYALLSGTYFYLQACLTKATCFARSNPKWLDHLSLAYHHQIYSFWYVTSINSGRMSPISEFA